MLTLLEQLDKGTLWQSPGGIHPPERKQLSNQALAARLPLAEEFIVPIPQVGELATLSLALGDRVLKGQCLTQGKGFSYLPVHAPTSGEVVAIESRPSNHASALPVLCCIIKADGLDTWCPLESASPESLSNPQILDKIKQAGIAGMGGAAFPSHIKLNPASEIDLVIINGIECEPYISADDRLMREHAAEILRGISIIQTLLTPERVIIAIEDNKPEAAKAMEQAIASAKASGQFDANALRVTQIPTKYPSGGEKQLIQIITGKEVPSGSLPAQLGIVVHNVHTAFAIQEAVLAGKPLIERLVTLTGEQVAKPGNYWLPIGTPLEHALTQVGFRPMANNQSVIVGGPMMGYAISTLKVPVLKGTNCLLAPSSHEIAPPVEEKACIRCGECALACPALLLPQQLFWHAKAEEYDKAASFNLKDCIECGCCSYVCPSDIPLVEYYRVAKSALRIEAEEKLQAERAKQRFETRLQRLEDEKLVRETKAKEAAARRQANMPSTDKNAVAEAMARIAAKKAAQEQGQDPSSLTPEPAVSNPGDKTSAVAAAVARAKAKKAALQQESAPEATPDAIMVNETQVNDIVTDADDKKAKVAAAVARAKAKKAALLQESAPEATSDAIVPNETQVNDIVTDADDKKAKVAAAVARAKAKKLAQAQEENSVPSANVSTAALDEVSSEVPDALVTSSLTPEKHLNLETPAVDDKKAKIAAAVAKAKAKKLAQATETSTLTSSENTGNNLETAITDTAADQKKANIAAAVAKAKARKLAEKAKQED